MKYVYRSVETLLVDNAFLTMKKDFDGGLLDRAEELEKRFGDLTRYEIEIVVLILDGLKGNGI
jgi:hypothetical protein